MEGTFTMATLIGYIPTMATALLNCVGSTLEVIAAQPILMCGFVIGLTMTGVTLFKKFLFR